MKIFDLGESVFIKGAMSQLIERLIRDKFSTNASVILTGLSGNETGDHITVDVTAKIVLSKKDVADILLKRKN